MAELLTKRDFYKRAIEELNLDVRDPFTNLFANACALVDHRDELKFALARRDALLRRLLSGSKNLDQLIIDTKRELGDSHD